MKMAIYYVPKEGFMKKIGYIYLLLMLSGCATFTNNKHNTGLFLFDSYIIEKDSYKCSGYFPDELDNLKSEYNWALDNNKIQVETKNEVKFVNKNNDLINIYKISNDMELKNADDKCR